MARALRTTTLSIDPLGSHFVVETPARGAPIEQIRRLPHGIPTSERGGGRVHAPAIPVVARALRALLAEHLVAVEEDAERLLGTLERLPGAATAVAHLCEHRPGTPGVIIATAPDPSTRALLSTLPQRRHDHTLDRWWIPATERPLAALRDLLDRRPSLTATAGVRERTHRFVQPALSIEAVAGLEHRCDVRVMQDGSGDAALRLCRDCHPGLEPLLSQHGAVTRMLGSWSVTIEGTPGLLELMQGRPDLVGDRGEVIADLRVAGARMRATRELEELSGATDGAVAIAGVAAPLHPFQGAAVDYALRTRRAFLADEPGLGKTVQTLATLQAAEAFPALIVCPASLRLNWLREAERWLPRRSAAGVVSGEPIQSDLAVASYEIAHTLVDVMRGDPPRALVLDESHLCKNPSARRTRAALSIAQALGEDAIVLLLTGTPVVNRPEELAAQLDILDRLDAVGGRRALAAVHRSAEGPAILNRGLRRTCFIRRRKADVLKQLPDKQRVVVAIRPSNVADYRAAQQNVARWVRDQAEEQARFDSELAGLPADERDQAIHTRGRVSQQRALRAEALVKITQLALLAARGKLDAAVEWITTFLENDEKLVVFVRHREIGDRLLDAFPDAACATGRLAADQRAEQVARFQGDTDCRLIVCSLDAAGIGLTMTAASNVAFLELGWTPGAHDQAEDRVHRIGQDQAVTAWYLLAADTIDEQIAALVERKRAIVSATTDGARATAESTVDELLTWLATGDGDASASVAGEI